jgi:hypothetical protein
MEIHFAAGSSVLEAANIITIGYQAMANSISLASGEAV